MYNKDDGGRRRDRQSGRRKAGNCGSASGGSRKEAAQPVSAGDESRATRTVPCGIGVSDNHRVSRQWCRLDPNAGRPLSRTPAGRPLINKKHAMRARRRTGHPFHSQGSQGRSARRRIENTSCIISHFIAIHCAWTTEPEAAFALSSRISEAGARNILDGIFS